MHAWMRDVERMSLARLDDERPAGLWITSLPWPRAAAQTWRLNAQPTYCRPIGQWPGEPDGTPRRLLMVADGGNQAPATLGLSAASEAPAGAPPTAENALFALSEDPYYMWERHRLLIRHQGRSLALAMGLRSGSEWHWWEACRLIVREETPTCRVVEMAGAIPLVHSVKSESNTSTYLNPWLHKHHWLYGHIQVRLHSNGVCEVFARHVNSKYVDDGADLTPAVPVIGFWTEDLPAPAESGLCGAWDGSRKDFTFGRVAFDVSEVARLATPKQPGRIDAVGDMLVWQPYRGCELFGGLCPAQRGGDGYILHAEAETIPRGMSRTLRFSFSLSDRAPRVARYLAPDWWYGLCEEFMPAPLLPVHSGAESRLRQARDWIDEAHIEGGFEDGGVARGMRKKSPGVHFEPGWEGEIPYAQFLAAWRYADARDYDLAMRSAYHFADVIVDHATNLVRMHGFPPVAFALPMNRVQGALAAFLETGDDFMFDTAEKVIEAANRQHRNAWPRLAVGRDACFVRGAALLYRYFANPHFRRIARDGALSVVQSQRANGSFGDQGGGSGIHQWSGYVTKPWMGLLAINGVLDYLEMFPDEPALVACVRRFADWLMAERGDREGVMSWGYQHDYNGGRTHQQNLEAVLTPLPSQPRWHQENLARLMGFCAERFNRRDYLAAWAESHAGANDLFGDHSVSAALQFLPWIQAFLWQTTIGPDRDLTVRALHFGDRTFPSACIHTPDGKVCLRWEGETPPQVRMVDGKTEEPQNGSDDRSLRETVSIDPKVLVRILPEGGEE